MTDEQKGARRSKSKGNRGEHEAARKMCEVFGCNVARAAAKDQVGLNGVHVEVKRRERLRLKEHVEQSVGDAKDDEVPVVMHRANRQPWLLTVRVEDLPEFIEKCHALLCQKKNTSDGSE